VSASPPGGHAVLLTDTTNAGLDRGKKRWSFLAGEAGSCETLTCVSLKGPAAQARAAARKGSGAFDECAPGGRLFEHDLTGQ